MQAIRLGLGDGATATSIDLLDPTAQCVLRGGLSLPPADPGASERELRLRLRLSGATEAELWGRVAAIERILAQAPRAAAPGGTGPWVTLSLQTDQGAWVYYDVLDGAIEVTELGPTSRWALAELRLRALPYARGAPLVAATQLVAGAGTLWLPSVPGDAPALVRLDLADACLSGAVNQVRAAVLADPALTTSSAAQVVLKPSARGTTSVVADADAVGGTRLERQLSDAMAVMAEVRLDPATTAGQALRGHVDVWARVRDPSTPLESQITPTITARRNPTPVQVAQAATGSDTTIAAQLGTPATAGQTLLAVLHTGDHLQDVPTPPGWVRVVAQDWSAPTSSNTAVYVFLRTARGGEEGVAFTFVNALPRALVLLVFDESLTYETDTAIHSSGQTPGAPSVGPGTSAYRLYLAYCASLAPVVSDGYGPWTHVTQVGGTRQLDLDLLPDDTPYSVTQSWTLSTASDYAAGIVRLAVSFASRSALPAGSVGVRIAPLNASGQGTPGPLISASLDGPGVYDVTWTGDPDATSYRVWHTFGDGWRYLDTTQASLRLSDTSGTLDEPPVARTTNARLQLQTGVGTTTAPIVWPAVETWSAANTWEWVRLGTVRLPPAAPALDGTEAPTLLWVAAQHLGSTPTLALDALALLPHAAPQAVATAVGTSERRQWTIATGRRERAQTVATGPGLSATTSGGVVILDADRQASVPAHWDGRPPEASVGIWVGTTNLLPNGSVETNLTGWSALGATLSRDTTTVAHGTASLTVVTNNNAAGEGATTTEGTGGVAVTAGTTYTGSAWLAGSGTVRIGIRWYDSSGAALSVSESATITLTSSWQRAWVTAAAPTGAARAALRVVTATQQAATIRLDAAQLEAQPWPTPYVHTDGASATRSTSQVQLPTALIAPTGWVALRVRPSVATATTSLLNYAVGTAEWRIQLVGGQARLTSTATGGGSITTPTITGYGPGQPVTLVAAWQGDVVTGATQGQISAAGQPFTTGTLSFPWGSTATSCYLGGVYWSAPSLLNGELLWLACGAGTLGQADAAWLAALGDAPPAPADLPAAARLTAVWLPATTLLYDATPRTTPSTQGGLLVPPGASAIQVLLGEGDRLTASMRSVRAHVRATVVPRYRYPRGD